MRVEYKKLDLMTVPKPTKSISKLEKITEEDLWQKQMEVLTAQLKHFEEAAALCNKQSELLDKQQDATDKFSKLLDQWIASSHPNCCQTVQITVLLIT